MSIIKKLLKFKFSHTYRGGKKVYEALNKIIHFDNDELKLFLSNRSTFIKEDYVASKLAEYKMLAFHAALKFKQDRTTRQCILSFRTDAILEKPNCLESIHIQCMENYSIEVTCKFRSHDYETMLETDLCIIDKFVTYILESACFKPICIRYTLFFSNVHRYENS